jgi:hypothetical protein
VPSDFGGEYPVVSVEEPHTTWPIRTASLGFASAANNVVADVGFDIDGLASCAPPLEAELVEYITLA